MGDGSRLDDLARDLASGTISRRTALGRLAAGALGIGLAAAPSVLADELERGSCPKPRRCGKKCCPKGAKCKDGKCKCKGGKKKCGKSCVDLQTDALNCGACKNECASGEICESGGCVALCGNGVLDSGEECDTNDLGGMSCADFGFAGGTLACDGNCQFDTSACLELCDTLICDDGNECTFDGCDNGFGCFSTPFPDGTPCSTGTCNGGNCE